MAYIKQISRGGTTYEINPPSIAGQFSTDSSYSAGDYVYYGGYLWRFTSDHSAGAWSGTDVEAVTVGGELARMSGGGESIPVTVRNAIYTLFENLVYTDNTLADELALVESWASSHCSGIVLSQSTLTISGIDTATLTATLTPADCTDEVVWTTSDSDVATVNEGVVTSVGNGTCTITATCGSYYATCSVTVSGIVATYTVTNTLTHITNSNSATVAQEESSYSATLSADSGYRISNVTVTMGGNDVTSTVYSGGTITIASVTGNIVITAVATEVPTPIYDWDFTQSLTDSVGGKTATLNGSAIAQDSNGVTITSASSYISFPVQLLPDSTERTVEIDIGSYDRKGTSHGRLFVVSNGNIGFIYRSTGKWAIFNSSSTWTESSVTSASAFDGKTLKFYIPSNSRTLTVSCEGVTVVSASIGNQYSPTIGYSQNTAYDLVIKAIRVYEGAV